MNNIHRLTVATILFLSSFSTMAQIVTAVDSTIEGAEKKFSHWQLKRGNHMKFLGLLLKTGFI